MTATATITISPLNDVVIKVRLSNVVAGTITPITAGTVVGFLATSYDPAATAADVTLQANLTYIGGNSDGLGGTHELDAWQFTLDAAVMTIALLDSLFLTTQPYLIVQKTSDRRVYVPLKYSRSQPAALAA